MLIPKLIGQSVINAFTSTDIGNRLIKKHPCLLDNLTLLIDHIFKEAAELLFSPRKMLLEISSKFCTVSLKQLPSFLYSRSELLSLSLRGKREDRGISLIG